MGKSSKFVLLAIVGLIISVVFAGCGSPVSTVTPGEEPITVVSVAGPLPPINPGGPNVEIVLKNTSSYPVISLTASLNMGRAYDYLFSVSSSQPLLPGMTTSLTKSLISGSIVNDRDYPLTLSGTLQSGGSFNFTVQVRITSPK